MKREYDFSKAKRGPVLPIPKGKTRITIRLDDTVLDWFRQQVNEAGGGNYQTLINDALRQHIARKPLEEAARAVATSSAELHAFVDSLRTILPTLSAGTKHSLGALRKVMREEIRRAS